MQYIGSNGHKENDTYKWLDWLTILVGIEDTDLNVFIDCNE